MRENAIAQALGYLFVEGGCRKNLGGRSCIHNYECSIMALIQEVKCIENEVSVDACAGIIGVKRSGRN
jgi:hypothetical protein